MRWPLRREPRGRHALGAAVTAIPSAPVPLPGGWQAVQHVAPEPVRAAAQPVQGVLPEPVRPLAPQVQHVVPEQARPPAPPVQDVVPEPVRPAAPSLPPLPVQPVDLDPALLDLAAGSLPLQPPAPSGPAPWADPPAPTVPDAPPPRLAPQPPPVLPATPAPPVSGPRVELGFADGTFRTLDPASSAARQLSDLVAELTGKGEGPSASAS